MGTSQGNRLVSASATKRPFQPGLRLPGRRPQHRARGPPRAVSLEASAELQDGLPRGAARNALREDPPRA